MDVNQPSWEVSTKILRNDDSTLLHERRMFSCKGDQGFVKVCRKKKEGLSEMTDRIMLRKPTDPP